MSVPWIPLVLGPGCQGGPSGQELTGVMGDGAMRVTSRAVMALSLGVAGFAGLAGITIGQDGAAPKTSGQQGGQARALPPAVIGSIDMDAVFKGYEKVDFIRKQIEAEANLKRVN